MGKARRMAANVAKYSLKINRKRIEKIMKKKRKGIVPMDVCSIDDKMIAVEPNCICQSETSPSAMETVDNEEPKESRVHDASKQPIVKADRLRRDALPLVSVKLASKRKAADARGSNDVIKSANSVIATRRMSKKKARKIMKIVRRNKKLADRME
ncbi:hypothetical protein AB6A40_000150 [Gnathostoma spinigerum]|uniref:Uncharacterized protein n=1 Tax=Gnathostoma spinigerum TaxID=75299 RepID=A0ABD6E3H7_9BILA